MYQMGVLSSIAALKLGYNRLQGQENRNDSHYKVAGNQLGYILNSIEKYNYFTNKMDFFSSDRVFNLVGLSAGFAFSVDDMIKSNVK